MTSSQKKKQRGNSLTPVERIFFIDKKNPTLRLFLLPGTLTFKSFQTAWKTPSPGDREGPEYVAFIFTKKTQDVTFWNFALMSKKKHTSESTTQGTNRKSVNSLNLPILEKTFWHKVKISLFFFPNPSLKYLVFVDPSCFYQQRQREARFFWWIWRRPKKKNEAIDQLLGKDSPHRQKKSSFEAFFASKNVDFQIISNWNESQRFWGKKKPQTL